MSGFNAIPALGWMIAIKFNGLFKKIGYLTNNNCIITLYLQQIGPI